MSKPRSTRKGKRKNEQPWWRTEGILVAGGWHPLPARIRAGAKPDNQEETYAWEYTEEHILRLKELGITVLISQFDRGLGPTDQAPEQENARLQAALCHKHGIRHGCYLANTVYYESVLKDHPECEDWVLHTFYGLNAHYGGEQSWRWVACFNSPGWRERMKREIKTAIEFVKTDWLHFDNLCWWPEPDSCHCPHCQRAFKEFLLARYPDDESQRRRFGFPGLEHFRAPNFYVRFTKPWDLARIDNPLMQDWIAFRCHSITDYITELAGYARELKPDVVIDSNGQSIRGCNQAIINGVRTDDQALPVDVVWDENPDYRPGESEEVPGVGRFLRGMNHFRRAGKRCTTSYRTEEELAWNITMGGDPGINSTWGYAEPNLAPLNEPAPGVAELLAHYKRHLELYTLQEPAARVGVWRNWQSLAFESSETHVSVCVMEHLLWKRRIPFSTITDRFIDQKELRAFDLLIVPNVKFVSDEQLRTIEEFVAAGGKVLLTEQTATRDGEERIRSRDALERLLKPYGRSDADTVFAEHGKGRAAYLPKIDYVHRAHSLEGGLYNKYYPGCDSRYWREPNNAAVVLDAIAWLYPDYQPVKVFGASDLYLDYLCLEDGSFAVPMLRTGEVKPVSLRLGVRARQQPKEGRLYVPEKARPVRLAWQRLDNMWETTLPSVGRHAVVRWSK